MSRARTLRRGAGAALALLASTALTAPARAQTAPPPTFNQVDPNGVDLVNGHYFFSMTEGSIGSGDGTLTLVRNWSGPASWNDNWSGTLYRRTVGGTTLVYVEFGRHSDTFSISGSTYTSTKGNGATLTGSGGGYVYTASDGTQINFSSTGPMEGYPYKGPACQFSDDGTCSIPVSIVEPNGMTYNLNWDVVERCNAWGQELNCIDPNAFMRFGGVTNSANYRFTVGYVTNNPGGFSVPVTDWYVRTGATFTNLADTPPTNPTVSYNRPSASVLEVTDTGGNTWRLTNASSGRLTGIRRPGASADTTVIAYSGSNVSSVTQDGIATSYAFSVSGSTLTTTITDAASEATVITTDLAVGRPGSVTDPLSRTTQFAYDGDDRLERVTMPEGNYVEYSYDSRGNVTETRMRDKDGVSGNDIVATATYSTSCTSGPACNRPTSTTDAEGNTTDYEWSSTHGGLISVTAPPPTSGATRPQTRYTYAQVTAVTGQPVYRLTEVSACSSGTAPSCLGTANESRTVIAYDTDNLNPVSVTRRDGTNALSAVSAMTYTPYGDVATVDGPLSGTDDTTTLRYDAARRLVGTISPDPDGGGSAPRRAVRTTYRADGAVTKQETGTVTGTDDTAWAAFSSVQEVQIAYDGDTPRATVQRLVSGGTTYSLTQSSYDIVGRPECTAVRMNPAEYSSLPTSACTIDTAGSYGPDRITRTVYDDAGQATQQLVGVGVLGSSQQGVAVATFGYTANGRLQHLTDGEDNLTTYVYDAHDRLSRTRYPVTTQGAATSSTTDYEELGYDDNGNVTSMRLRDGTSIGFTVDALGRVTAENRPGSEPDVTYAYDLLSRLTGASLSTGQNVSRGYDALDRLVSEGSYVSSHANQYDAAGRRTRMTWSDGFYVDYDYLVTGETTAIRENGATSGAGVLATFGYDSLGRRTSLTRGNGAVTTYGYDAVSRLDQLDEAFAGTTHDVNRTFAYNPASQIVQATRSNALFAFDVPANMNRVDTHNGLNQILQTDANATPPVDIDHDARGNITDDGPRTYTYDSRNRLTHSGGPSNTWLAYDALGRLLSIVPGGANHDYPHHDGWTIVSEYSGSAALRRRYVHGPGVDEPLVWYEGTGTNDRRWLHADERGSVVGVSDGTGAATNVNAYDEYGIPGAAITGRFGYTGQAWLPTIGIYHYRHRNYHPVLGRFMQPDPIGYWGGMNLYAYVGNDPINWRDPLGLEEEGVTITLCPPGYKFDREQARCISPTLELVARIIPSDFDLGSHFQLDIFPDNSLERIIEDLARGLRRQICSLGSFHISGGLDAYLGIGASAGSGVSFDWRTGQIGFLVTGGGGVGYGGGFSASVGAAPPAGTTITDNFVGAFGPVSGSASRDRSSGETSFSGGPNSGFGPRVGAWSSRTINSHTQSRPLYNACR